MFTYSELQKLYQQKNVFAKRNNERVHSLEYVSVVINKLYLFTEEFKQWRRVIYIDADMMVKASLDGLVNINGFAAVEDMLGPKFKQHFSIKDNALLWNLKQTFNFDESAFNDGLFVFSTDIIKKETFDTLKELFKKYYLVTRCVEQSILNVFFYKKWHPLSIGYNAFRDIVGENHGEIVLHYAGKVKPSENNSTRFGAWVNSLKKADAIYSVNVANGEFKKYRPYQIRINSLALALILRRQRMKNLIFSLVKNFSAVITQTTDANLGKIGIILKAKLPKTYYFIKKMKK